MSTVTNLKEIPLPGLKAHKLLAPPNRIKLMKTIDYNKIKSKKAAVLICIYPNAVGQANFVLIERNVYPGVHSGQISFPGGKPEPHDLDLWATALREANEEVGIPSSQVQQLKTMSKIFIPPSNFTVTPFLSYCHSQPPLIHDLSEVSSIIEFPLGELLTAEVSMENCVISGKNLSKVPAYVYDQKIVWGATAMILSELKKLILNGLYK